MVDKSALDKFVGASVAALAKVTKGEGLLGKEIRHLTGNTQFCGRAVTAMCPYGDNGALHRAIAVAGSEDVIVGMTSGPTPIGMWGGISSVAATDRDIKALVLDGMVTDVGEISDAGFCVFSRGSSAYPPIRKTKGNLNIPILIEGVMVHPGDVIIGDEDGVICIPADKVDEVLDGYAKQISKEAGILERVRAGETTAAIFGVK